MPTPPRGTRAPSYSSSAPSRWESGSNSSRAAWIGRVVPAVGPRQLVPRLRPCPTCLSLGAARGR